LSDLTYAESLSASLIRITNRLLLGGAFLCALSILARLAGGGEITVDAAVTVDVEWILFVLILLTFIHWWLAGRIAGELRNVWIDDARNRRGRPNAALLGALPSLGWYTHGVIPRSLRRNGMIIFSWRDPTIQLGLASCLLVLVAVMPWSVRHGHLRWSTGAPEPFVAVAFVLAGLNWRFGAVWISRVAELQLAPGDRHLAANDHFYDNDSFGSAHGCYVAIGALCLWIAVGIFVGVLVARVTGTIVGAIAAGIGFISLPVVSLVVFGRWTDWTRNRRRRK